MLEARYIYEHFEEVKQAIQKLNTTAPVEEIYSLYSRRKELLYEVEQLKNKRNIASQEVPKIKDPQEKKEKLNSLKELSNQIKTLDQKLNVVEEKLKELLLLVPNLPHPSVPVGKDESENIVISSWGKPREFGFTPLPHWELGEMWDIIDFERGVKISGTRFYILKGWGAKLQRALINWMLDIHITEHGYKEIYPPCMVKEECLLGTGNLPKFSENLYRDWEENIWWIPTAEVPLTNLHRDEILEPEINPLPIYYVAYTPCFRREKMSAGRETRGIKRGHQFDKVELVKFVEPEKSMEELDKLIEDAGDILKKLNLPFRVVQMCTGDLSFTAAIKYDLEVWAPGCGEWLEVSSCSNFMDFQARRANIRYRPYPKAKPRLVHTLNGSGLALPRLVIALLETYQQEDCTITLPEVLLPYMGKIKFP